MGKNCCRCLEEHHKRVLTTFARVLSGLLPYLSILLLLWIIVLFISPNPVGICYPFNSIEYLIKCLGGVLTLWVITYNLEKYIDVETVRLLGDLRKVLHTNEKKVIHNYLLESVDKERILPEIDDSIINPPLCRRDTIHNSNIELFDYLGCLELGVIMLIKGLISRSEFDNQFGYRIENIRRNDRIMNHLSKERQYYEYLWYYLNC